VSEWGGEVGMFVNNVCVGAAVIKEPVTIIRAHIKEFCPIYLANATIEFQIYHYGTRSAPTIIDEFIVLDSSYNRVNCFSTKSRYYTITLLEEYDKDDPEITPLVTHLNGNFPNPFNPSTNIDFTLANELNVRIDIYNIRGQRVRTLVNEPLGVGRHTVMWNGDDQQGRDVSSGIYFYRFEAGNVNEIRRMLLLK